jgi:trimethylamine--corrinoid protein Co-methyltransferase
VLNEYEAPAMDAALDESILDFVNRKKASMPDQWY